MAQITGIAKRYDEAPVDYVSIFNWENGKCIAQVVPDALGNWLYSYTSDLNIGITYVSDGCEPVTHGSYHLVHAGYRYWRVSNIKARVGNDYKGIATLQFLDINGNNLSTDPAKASASHYFGSPSADNAPANAFDGNPGTWTEVNANKFLVDWFIFYDFGEDVNIKSIGTAARNDVPIGLGREWQTADVDYSVNGIEWVRYGVISPNTPADDSSLIISMISKV